jgi:methionyl-tRNA formyltransferase
MDQGVNVISPSRAGRTAAVIGKGAMAAHACDVLAGLASWDLRMVVTTEHEPDWDVCLSAHVVTTYPDVTLDRSGDWRTLLSAKVDHAKLDLVFSVMYDRIIRRELIDAGVRILNLHPGRLPEYRGVRPVNWALRNRDRVHGVTIHEIDAGVDTGPIVAMVEFPIWPEVDEVRDVWQRCNEYGSLLITDTLHRLDALEPVPQDDSKARVHRSRDNHLLGDRLTWTKAESIAELEEADRSMRGPS